MDLLFLLKRLELRTPLFFVLRHRARLIVQSHENHFQLQERKFKSSSASMSNESKMRNNCFVIPVTVPTKRSPPCVAA